MSRVTMLVTSELDHDPRVQKEAMLAFKTGFDVTVICRSYTGAPMPYKVIAFNSNRQDKLVSKYIERLQTNAKLYQMAVATCPDIIHANDLDTLPAAYYAARKSRAALLYDAHELWSDMGGSRAGRIGKTLALHSERYFSHRAEAVVTVSHYRGQAMCDALHINPPTVVMNTPYYVAPESLVPGAWLEAFSDKQVVLYQGRFTGSMGLVESIKSAHFLPSDVVLVFRGYGPFADAMQRAIQQEHLESRVFIVPPVPMNELVVSAVGASLGLVVYNPVNLNNLYAAPNKLFEFLMAGVPCVGSDLPYLREILCGHDLGAVFEPSNSADLARAVLDLLEDRQRLEEMKRRCLQYAHLYCWEIEGCKLMREYERLIAEKGSVLA